MSRLYTHTLSILMFATCMAWGNSALAFQSNTSDLFPSTLSQAVDRQALRKQGIQQAFGSRLSSSRRSASPNQTSTQHGRAPQNEIDFLNQNPEFSEMSPLVPPAKNDTRQSESGAFAPPVARVAEAPETEGGFLIQSETRSRHSNQFQPALSPVAAPFARQSQPGSEKLSFPHPQQTPNQSSQPEFKFGTVTTFPAANDDNVSPIDNLSQIERNPGGDKVSNVYRPPSKFDLTSAPINNPRLNNDSELIEPLPHERSSDFSHLSTPFSLRLSVVGPVMLEQNTPGEYEIVIVNSSQRLATEILVQLSVSGDLTITQLDRQAWMDGANRTVSWKIETLQAGAKEVIRFRAASGFTGRHEQSITLGMNDTYQGQTSFIAAVVPSTNAKDKSKPKHAN